MDHKTLAQLRKPQPQHENKEDIEMVIEDCQVNVDDSSCGDWLLAQGLTIDTSSLADEPQYNEVDNLQGGQSQDNNDDILKNDSVTDNTMPSASVPGSPKQQSSGTNDKGIHKKGGMDDTTPSASVPGSPKHQSSGTNDKVIHKKKSGMDDITPNASAPISPKVENNDAKNPIDNDVNEPKTLEETDKLRDHYLEAFKVDINDYNFGDGNEEKVMQRIDMLKEFLNVMQHPQNKPKKEEKDLKMDMKKEDDLPDSTIDDKTKAEPSLGEQRQCE